MASDEKTDTKDPNIATLRALIDDTPGYVSHGRTIVMQEAVSALASTLAERTNELAAYQRTWGPLLIGAEPVKCLGCYNRTERITELEATLAERDRRIAELEENALRWLELEASRLAELQADADKAGNCYGNPELTLLELIETVDIAQRGKRKQLFRTEVARSALELMQARLAKAELRVREKEKEPPAPAPGELAKALYEAPTLKRYTDPDLAEENQDSGEYQMVPLAVMAPIVLAARSWQRLQWRPASEAPCGMLLTTYEADGERIFVIDEKHAEDDGWDERDDMALPIDALPALNGGE